MHKKYLAIFFLLPIFFVFQNFTKLKRGDLKGGTDYDYELGNIKDINVQSLVFLTTQSCTYLDQKFKKSGLEVDRLKKITAKIRLQKPTYALRTLEYLKRQHDAERRKLGGLYRRLKILSAQLKKRKSKTLEKSRSRLYVDIKRSSAKSANLQRRMKRVSSRINTKNAAYIKDKKILSSSNALIKKYQDGQTKSANALFAKDCAGKEKFVSLLPNASKTSGVFGLNCVAIAPDIYLKVKNTFLPYDNEHIFTLNYYFSEGTSNPCGGGRSYSGDVHLLTKETYSKISYVGKTVVSKRTVDKVNHDPFAMYVVARSAEGIEYIEEQRRVDTELMLCNRSLNFDKLNHGVDQTCKADKIFQISHLRDVGNTRYLVTGSCTGSASCYKSERFRPTALMPFNFWQKKSL